MREINLHQSTSDNDFNKKFTIMAVGDKNPVTGAHNHYVVGGVLPQGVPDFDGQTGLSVLFQNGRPDDNLGPNGFSMEVLLAIVADRLDAFQTGQFPHPCNEIASKKIKGAIEALHYRSMMVDQDTDMTQELMDSYCKLLLQQAVAHGLELNFPIGSVLEFNNGRLVPPKAADDVAKESVSKPAAEAFSKFEYRTIIERNGKPTVTLFGCTTQDLVDNEEIIGRVALVDISEGKTPEEKNAIMEVARQLIVGAPFWPTLDNQEIITGMATHDFVAFLPNIGVVASSLAMAEKYIYSMAPENRKPMHAVCMVNNDGTMNRNAYCRSLITQSLYETALVPEATDVVADTVEEDAGPQPTAVEGIRCVGIYNEHSAKFYVDPEILAPITVEVAPGVEQLTSAFKFGERFSMLGISGSKALFDAGLIDHTDELDPLVSVETVYVQLVGAIDGVAVKETVAFVVGAGPATQAGCTAVPYSASNATTLVIDSVFLLELYAGILQISGEPSALMASVMRPEDDSVYLHLKVNGVVSLQTAEVTVNAGVVVEPSETDSNFEYEGSLLELMHNAQPLGYELLTTRVNRNRAPR